MFAVCVSWSICHILTVTDTLPKDVGSHGYHARTDAKSSVIRDAEWFRVPYPGLSKATIQIFGFYLRLCGIQNIFLFIIYIDTLNLHYI